MKCAPQDIDENTGDFELKLRNGRFRWTQVADHPIAHPFFSGIYTGTGHELVLIFDPNTADEGRDTLRWKFSGKSLLFTVITVDPGGTSGEHFCVARMVYESHPWKKTG